MLAGQKDGSRSGKGHKEDKSPPSEQEQLPRLEGTTNPSTKETMPKGETIFVFISYLISFFPNRSTDNVRNATKSSTAKRANGNGWNAVDAIPAVKSWSEHETR